MQLSAEDYCYEIYAGRPNTIWYIWARETGKRKKEGTLMQQETSEFIQASPLDSSGAEALYIVFAILRACSRTMAPFEEALLQLANIKKAVQNDMIM